LVDQYVKSAAAVELIPPDSVHALTAANTAARALRRLEMRLREVDLVPTSASIDPAQALRTE